MKALTTFLRVLFITAIVGFASNGMSHNYGHHKHYPINLEVMAPHGEDGLPVLSDSGWPILLAMTIKEEDSLGYWVSPNFPNLGSRGSILFDDPDGLISWDDFACCQTPPCTWAGAPPECPLDETYLRFYADTDVVGAADHAGDSAQRALLVDSAGSASPEFQEYGEPGCTPGTESTDCVKMGPNTGGEVSDGWGIGSDDDIPGLVLLSGAGIGIAFPQSPTPLFELPDPLVLRNLAGLNSFVSYELAVEVKSPDSRWSWWRTPEPTYVSKVLVGYNVPAGMVRNIVQVDECVGDPVGCAGQLLYKVDAGSVETAAPDLALAAYLSTDLFDFTEFELSAFVVSGSAPAELADEDGDGDVDSDDAELAGFTLLSNEVHFSVVQYDKRVCFGGGMMAMFWDLDVNGNEYVPMVCPAGPGNLKRPPR